MIIALIILLAVFVQSSVGFGLALVSMPLLIEVMGIQAAAPLVALIGTLAEAAILIRYREALNLRAVVRLTVASLIAIPLGVLALRRFDADVVTTILGVILIGYALYSLLTPRLPTLAHHGWEYAFGFVAGLLGGAYNTSGPPVIIYGNSRRWPPAEFKCNLQGFFLVNGVALVAVHAFSGNYTQLVWQSMIWAVPAALVGLLLGFSLDRWLNAERFRTLVLLLLIVIGIRLIVS